MKLFNKISTMVALIVAITFGLTGPITAFAATSPSLGTADSFAILAGTPNITDAGGASVITGDVGLSPATGAGIGLLSSQVTGTIYAVDAFGPVGSVNNPGLLTTAKADLVTAYDGLAALDNATCTGDYTGTGVKDLTTVSPLVPGVYCADAFTLTGNLTLSGSGVYIFRSTSTIITSPGSSVTATESCDVWWRAESSVTLDTTTSFVGNVLALTDITMNTGATLTGGRLLARNGAVTLDHNTISNALCRVTPGLPDSGIGGNNNIPWYLIALTSIFAVSLISVFAVQRKKQN